MDILKILEESGKELYIEDLDFFEAELATGGPYSKKYVDDCKTKINQLRNWIAVETAEKTQQTAGANADGVSSNVIVGIGSLAPKEANPVAELLTPDQIIFSEINAIRENNSYKSSFKNYIVGKNEIDEGFIDKNYSFFSSWELDAIISVKQMSEEFLEKYFGALDHDKIARYQKFSEAFFMKHFSQMDYSVVLEHGKNEWRKKGNRSKQLDIFLRLKGVKI